MEGLEPPCLAALDPKSSASTNFATSAFLQISGPDVTLHLRTRVLNISKNLLCIDLLHLVNFRRAKLIKSFVIIHPYQMFCFYDFRS